MKIAVLGASGGCGRWVTRLAVDGGHQVTALVRPGTPFGPPAEVAVRRGSALDESEVFGVAQGHDVVISCIGPQRVNPRDPWSPLRPPAHVAERSAHVIVRAMQRAGVRRLVAISAAGVTDSLAKTNGMMRWLIAKSTIGEMYADLGAMERVFSASDLDWTAVRPVVLVNAPASSRARVVTRFRTHSVIGRADVAAWLLGAAVGSQATAERTPMIGWW